MNAFKQFKNSDILVTPFKVNKDYNFNSGEELDDPEVNIRRYGAVSGLDLNNPLNSSSFYQTTPNPNILYESIKHLYYSNYTTSKYGDEPNLPRVIRGVNAEDDILVGESSSKGRYFNYLQTTLTFPKIFENSIGKMGVISIPKNLFGEYIMPTSFEVTFEGKTFKDDGEGNILLGTEIFGNIFYSHGIIIIFFKEIPNLDWDVLILGDDLNLKFTSTLTIFETQYKCTINNSEFNNSLNPSLQNNQYGEVGGDYSEIALNKDFKPYITTVGLYNDNHELLAVCKLSFPLPSSQINDTTIIVNIDK